MEHATAPSLRAASDEPVKEKISTKLYFASLYFISTGVLYLWGYWPNFGINILEYLDISDILKVTAYPMTIAVLTVGISGAVAHWVSTTKILPRMDLPSIPQSFISEEELNRLEQELLSKVRIARRVTWLLKWLYFILLSAISIAAFMDWQHAWLFLPPFLAIPPAVWLTSIPYFKSLIESKRIPLVTVFLIAMIPALSYSIGRTNASNIIEGKLYRYSVSDITAYPASSTGKDLRYVGHAGDYIFLYDAKKQATVILKLDDDKPIALKYFKNEDSLNIFLSFRNRIVHLIRNDRKNE